jgi:hypothetical protein
VTTSMGKRKPWVFNPCKTMWLPDDIRLDGGVDWEELTDDEEQAHSGARVIGGVRENRGRIEPLP